MKRQPPRQPSFSRIVCSSPQVLEAFGDHSPTRSWWKLVLKLHGKPVRPALSSAEKTRLVAEGFHFYAALYRGLSVLFALLCPVLYALHALDENSISLYAAGGSAVAAVYLWFVSGLGYVGAQSYAHGEEQGRVSLLAFMVMIVAFLCVFVGAVSVAAQQSSAVSSGWNLLSTTALLTLGVGSYFIEIVYLATEARPALSDISRA